MNLIRQWDEDLFIYLNSLGSHHYDAFWLFVTNQFHWVILYVLVAGLYFYYLGWKKGLTALLLIFIFLGLCDQSTNFIKNYFLRLRPSADPALSGRIRDLIHPHNYSFVSGHASNSTVFVWFSIFLLRKYTKYIYVLVIWWLIFMYSRIYVGVHYPLDILGGILWGLILTFLARYLFIRINASSKLV